MPCDAACQKIIINTGFMATLAPILAKQHAALAPTSRPSVAIAMSATKLSEAASVLRDMLTARGLTVDKSNEFDSCEQARTLVAWIDGVNTDAGPSAPEAVTKMDAWTADIWKTIEDLAAGKFPG